MDSSDLEVVGVAGTGLLPIVSADGEESAEEGHPHLRRLRGMLSGGGWDRHKRLGGAPWIEWATIPAGDRRLPGFRGTCRPGPPATRPAEVLP